MEQLTVQIMGFLGNDILGTVAMSGVGVWGVFFGGLTTVINLIIKINVEFNTRIVDPIVGVIPPLHGWVQGKQVAELKSGIKILENGIKKIEAK